MKNTVVGLLFLIVVGCATGQPSEEPPRLPIYEDAQEVPCRHENIQAIRHRTTIVLRIGDEYNDIRDLELSKIGIELGADAVILAPQNPNRPISIERNRPMTAFFDGTAIRYLENPCGGGTG